MTDYTETLLDHYRYPRSCGHLSNCLSATATNSTCGDSITVYFRQKSGKISEFKWQGTGCAISQASASILSEKIIGKSPLSLHPLRVTPARIACATLVFKAIANAK